MAARRTIPSRSASTLTEELYDVFQGVIRKKVDPKIACEASRAVGAITRLSGKQLEYQIARGEKPNIPFLNG